MDVDGRSMCLSDSARDSAMASIQFIQHSLLWYLLGLSFILASSYLFPKTRLYPSQPESAIARTPVDNFNPFDNNDFNLALELQRAHLIPEHSLTVVFPLALQSLSFLDDILFPFLKPSPYILEIVIVCPVSIISEARLALRRIHSSNSDYPDLLLHSLVGGLDQDSGVINAASQVSTEWVLVMNQLGLSQTSNHSQALLLHPPVIPVPMGPRGVFISTNNVSCLLPSEVPQRASYLYPPFVMPASLAIKLQSASEDPWAALGHRISESRSDGLGGIAVGMIKLDPAWCSNLRHTVITPPHSFGWDNQFSNDDITNSALPAQPGGPPTFGMFVIFLPTLHDLRIFSSLACLLQKGNHDLKVFIYDELASLDNKLGWDVRYISVEGCRLAYSVDLSRSPFSLRLSGRIATEWLETFSRPPDIILGLSEEASFIELLAIRPNDLSKLIRIPRSDLPYCDWMGSLSLTEWRSLNFLSPRYACLMVFFVRLEYPSH